MILLWSLVKTFVLNMVLKKSIFNKIPFYIKRSTEISGVGLHFYQQASSLIGYQTNQRTNPFLSYNTMSWTLSAFAL